MDHYPRRIGPARTRNGSTRAWRKLRQQILTRDGHTCQECGEFPATHVDHITPISYGGTDDPSNLQATCAPCNQAKGPHLGLARWRT